MTKIGFLGAMNRDVVVRQPAATVAAALGMSVPPLVETPVSDEVGQRGVVQFTAMGAETHLGGSAFNVARVVALLNKGSLHDLQFFGLAGLIGDVSPHLSALRDWGVTTSIVHTSPLPPATCLAMVEPAGRTLLTAQGANAGICDWLMQHRRDLVAEMARCDIVHVTSFLSPEAPGLIAGHLELAREVNPDLVVSLDPGMAWIAEGGNGFADLLRQTRILHVNAEELHHLGSQGALPDMAEALAPDALLMARRHDGATIFRLNNGLVVEETLSPEAQAMDARAIDPNGAGDTFCGGFLWRYASDPDHPLAAAELGYELARHKVGINGPLTETEIERAMRIRWEDW